MIRNAVAPLFEVVGVVVSLPRADSVSRDAVVRGLQRVDLANEASDRGSHDVNYAQRRAYGVIHNDRFRIPIR